MTDDAFHAIEMYVAPGPNGVARDGSLAHPFASLADALAAVAERYGGPVPTVRRLAGRDRVEIVQLAEPGKEPAGGRLRHQYFIDLVAEPLTTPDGSELVPWPDLNAALPRLVELHRRGELLLAPGERLRIAVREVFTHTPGDRRKRRQEFIARSVSGLMTLALVVPIVAILAYLTYKAAPVLSASFLFQNPKNNMTAGGIWSPLIGTFYLVFCSLVVAAPIGVLAGVYLNEYARDNWFTRVVNLAVVNLAGVPSIVHALFGVGAFVLFAGMGESVLAASCTLAIMTLPVIIASTKEALSSVPQAFRAACWNMGASRWQTIRTIVLPNSISGILTGVILQVSRAAGETAPILFTGAAFFVPTPNSGLGYVFPYKLTDSCMALSYHLHTLLTQVRPPSAAAIKAGRAMPLEDLQFGTAFVLIGLVLVVNSLSIGLRVYLRSRKKW